MKVNVHVVLGMVCPNACQSAQIDVFSSQLFKTFSPQHVAHENRYLQDEVDVRLTKTIHKILLKVVLCALVTAITISLTAQGKARHQA